METQSENQDIEPINLDQELDQSESSFDDTGRKRKRTSVIWQHFEEKSFCVEVKAICNHCKARLASGSTVGTSSLLSHVRTCPILTTKKKSPFITGDGSTIKRDIMKVFECEKGETMKLLQMNKSKIAITTDMWTSSNQKRGFMAITSHFIDALWTLQSRILR
ncbi:hypothetical protein ACFX10_041376 [Malus domestica]